MEIITKTFDNFDLEAFKALYLSSLEPIFKKLQVTQVQFEASYFKWKYNSPFGKALITAAVVNNRLQSASVMQPIRINVKGKLVTIWHCMDSIALNNIRARGTFRATLKQSLYSPVGKTMVIGLPNANAMNAVVKLGCDVKEIIPWKVGPTLRLTFISYKYEIREIDSLENFPMNFKSSTSNYSSIHKDQSFFVWRYFKHPCFQYKTYCAFDKSNSCVGIMTTRLYDYKGIKTTLIMELHSVDNIAVRELLRYASSKSVGSPLFLSVTNGEHLNALNGFFPVPANWVPKKQVLVSLNHGMPLEEYNDRLILNMGDWDAF